MSAHRAIKVLSLFPPPSRPPAGTDLSPGCGQKVGVSPGQPGHGSPDRSAVPGGHLAERYRHGCRGGGALTSRFLSWKRARAVGKERASHRESRNGGRLRDPSGDRPLMRGLQKKRKEDPGGLPPRRPVPAFRMWAPGCL